MNRTVTLFATGTQAMYEQFVVMLVGGTPRETASPIAAPETEIVVSRLVCAEVEGKSRTAVTLTTLTIGVPPPTVKLPATVVLPVTLSGVVTLTLDGVTFNRATPAVDTETCVTPGKYIPVDGSAANRPAGVRAPAPPR